MPYLLTSQEFWPKYNVGIFAPKLVDRIFSGPRKKRENSLERKEKKNSVKFCKKIPLVPTSQEFRPECNVAIFA